MLAKASDKHDTELIGAFVKLAQILPPVLAEHVEATVDVFSTTPPNERFTRVFRTLAEAWAQRRVVEIEYDTAVYDPTRAPRRTRVQPWAIEPSALTHALYLIGWDEARAARRTFKVERIISAALTPDTFAAPARTPVRDLLRAWDVIADEPPVKVVIRFSPAVARRAAETRWHPSQQLEQQPDGSLIWRGRFRACARSASGSSAGAPTLRSSNPPSCAATSPRSCAGPRRFTDSPALRPARDRPTRGA